MTTLRVVTWNIAAARRGVAGGPRTGLSAVADTLRGLDADLIALQEVDRGIGRSGFADQPRLLGEALGMRSWFAPAIRTTGYDGPWEPVATPGQDTGEAAYGIVLLARLPLETVTPCPLPFGAHPRPGQEQRVALAATIHAGDHRLTVAATHLDWRLDRATSQLRHLQEWLAGWPGPRVLLGDLNLRPWRVAVATRRGWRRAARGLTFPAARPRRQIDHVLLDSRAVRARAGRVVAAPVSDHRALLAEIELPA